LPELFCMMFSTSQLFHKCRLKGYSFCPALRGIPTFRTAFCHLRVGSVLLIRFDPSPPVNRRKAQPPPPRRKAGKAGQGWSADAGIWHWAFDCQLLRFGVLPHFPEKRQYIRQYAAKPVTLLPAVGLLASVLASCFSPLNPAKFSIVLILHIVIHTHVITTQ